MEDFKSFIDEGTCPQMVVQNAGEILKNNGLNEDQITNILNSMKEAKVYTTKHENIDERYNKLKTQKTELETQIKESESSLSVLLDELDANEFDKKGLEELKKLLGGQ